MARFVIRLDDICPCMDHRKFQRAKSLFDQFDVRPLLGIVPENRDPELDVEDEYRNFWTDMLALHNRGWSIAQHGCHHVYETDRSGILRIQRRSEFAGIPIQQQREKLLLGRALLRQHGVQTDTFMPPSHSFDRNTIAALQECGFRCVTDGFGVRPYVVGGITFVPQLFATPRTFLNCGLYTICLHLNSFAESDFERLHGFIRTRYRDIVTFDDARSDPKSGLAEWFSFQVIRAGLTTARRMRRWRLGAKKVLNLRLWNDSQESLLQSTKESM